MEDSYVTEGDAGERSAYSSSVVPQTLNIKTVLTTAGVVDNLLHDAPDVPIALRLCQLASVHVPRLRVRRRTYEVESAELGRSLVQAGVGREDRAATFTLVANDPTHGDGVVLQDGGRQFRTHS
jgi:hypothetical protein